MKVKVLSKCFRDRHAAKALEAFLNEPERIREREAEWMRIEYNLLAYGVSEPTQWHLDNAIMKAKP